MKKRILILSLVCTMLCQVGCKGQQEMQNELPDLQTDIRESEGERLSVNETTGQFNLNSKISQVMSDPVFEDYGRLIFPVDEGYWSGDTLKYLRLVWYSNIDPNKTVEVVNTLWQQAYDGNTVFYDIYTEEEKAADPDKKDTGLFFFRGEPGAKFAVCNAGGGFAYVGCRC